jgi:hypothetical protein
MSCHSQTHILIHTHTHTHTHTHARIYKNNQTLARSPLFLYSSLVPRVIEVGIPVNPKTTHATLEPSFLVGDAFITVKVLCLGLYTMHNTQTFLRIKKKKKENHRYHLTFDFYCGIRKNAYPYKCTRFTNRLKRFALRVQLIARFIYLLVFERKKIVVLCKLVFVVVFF